jgi:hypothetical protein
MEAVTREERLLRAMLRVMRSYMGSWSVMWRGLVGEQPIATARLEGVVVRI